MTTSLPLLTYVIRQYHLPFRTDYSYTVPNEKYAFVEHLLLGQMPFLI